MALYVAICLLAALSVVAEDELEHRGVAINVIWGTTLGLALAHWFAFRLSARCCDAVATAFPTHVITLAYNGDDGWPRLSSRGTVHVVGGRQLAVGVQARRQLRVGGHHRLIAGRSLGVDHRHGWKASGDVYAVPGEAWISAG